MKPIIFISISLLLTCIFSARGQSLIIPKEIHLPDDTTIKNELINSLNGLLDQKEKTNKENSFVLKEDLLEMSALLDEFKGMEQNTKLKDDHFYKLYLTNVVDIGADNYLIQLSYMGVVENAPVVRASFTLNAKRQGPQFYFCSPLKQNTLSWKTKKLGNIIFRYRDTLNLAEAKAYLKIINAYDKRLKIPAEPVTFYACGNFPTVLQISGIDYKSNYAGRRYDDLSSHENNSTLEVNGGYNGAQIFDRHDLWHARLRVVMDPAVINRPVDEGCAYLYGGSWGTPWDEILTMFKNYAAAHPDADWMKLYVENGKLRDDDKPIYIPYAINALIVRKIEGQKGFVPVMELLASGKREKGDENYFKALGKVSGINKAGFNKEVSDLIKE